MVHHQLCLEHLGICVDAAPFQPRRHGLFEQVEYMGDTRVDGHARLQLPTGQLRTLVLHHQPITHRVRRQ
jgi:hypothetical protein